MSILVSAIKKVRAMDIGQKEKLADELFRQQPNMFGSVLVQQQMGVSLEKMEFSLEILFICFQCMKESKLIWPLISQDEQDKQLARYVASVKFGEGLSPTLKDRAMKQYLKSHPEQSLLAFVTAETNNWLSRIVSEDTDRYVILAAINLVNCITFVPMPSSTVKTRARS